MNKLQVEAGQRFGRLTVVEETRKAVPSRPSGHRAAVCTCDCGATTVVFVRSLINGRTTSCGCAQRESAQALGLRVGGSPEQIERLARYRNSPENVARLQARAIHGLHLHPLYSVWQSMVARCEKPGHKSWKAYGGRGIGVYEPWHDVAVFIEDVERDIGPRPEGRSPGGTSLYSLDRSEVNGNYEPGNIRWATWSEQAANRRQAQTTTASS